MKTKGHKRLFLTLTGLLLCLVWMSATTTVAQAADTVECLQLNVPFGATCVNNLGEYIQNFYRYFVGAIGIFGVAMIMYAGIRWIASNGNSKEIDAAKEQINSAIFGVFLALVSYALLYLVNPMLTNLSPASLDADNLSINQSSLQSFCSSMLGPDWKTKVTPAAESSSCGQRFVVASTGQTCLSDSCAGGQLCMPHPYTGTYTCLLPSQVCEDTPSDNCETFDQQISSLSPLRGCAKVDTRGLRNKCTWGEVLKPGAAQERVSCLDEAASGICSLSVGGLPKEYNDCNSGGFNSTRHFCTDKTRAIEGADAICVKNIVENTYECLD